MLFFIRICVWLVIWARRLWRRIFYNVLYWFVYFSSISSNTWWSNLKVFHQSIRLIIFLMTTIMTSIVSIQLYLFKTTIIGGYLLSYDSPLIILSSLFLFLLFEKMNFYSSFINACSSSALSIYLIHINPHIWGYFKEGVLSLYNISPDYYGCLLVFLYLLVIMSICILIDKIRLKLTPMNNLISIGNIVWNKISTII